jgi:hypothetical protein
MRNRLGFRLGLASAMVAALSLAPIQLTTASGADLGGDFIIRCFYNGNHTTQDPIAVPSLGNSNSFNTDHLHAFFGNLASGGVAMNGTTQVPFPGIMAGEDGSHGTMEHNGLSPVTNCQDSKDTAGYWIPEPFTESSASATPQPYLPGNGCRTTGCSTNGNLYMRDYYIPDGSNNAEIPDGTIMIAGFPNGCAGVSGHGCGTSGTGFPNDLSIVEYSCGADSADGLSTPHSAWPYDCTNYTDGDDGFTDGIVAFVNFPYCWNGHADFPAPNSPPNASGLPTTMVPGYVPSWVNYTAWKAYKGLTARPVNDFTYPGSSGCPSGDITTVQLQERVHLLTSGQGLGEPSTCAGDRGINWNSTANVENSASGGTVPSDTAETYEGKVNNDGDATVQVGATSGGTAIWGFHKCQAPVAPNPTAGATEISFACSPTSLGGDQNCTDNIGIPATTTGCGAVGSPCFVGKYPFGWETLHADYWQTWQEAQNPPDSQPGSTDVSSDSGTFGDLVEDCNTGTGSGSCSFVTNSSPPAVYASPGNPNP